MQKILIVDDEPINIKILAEILKNPDHEILTATNGVTALELASVEDPDLILLDIMMPQVDGYEVCSSLKSDKQTRNIPVIFVTACGEEDDETLGLELGAVDYITKPIHPSIVKARVKNHLELKRKRDILEALSITDGLTGIANRRRFDEFLNYEWMRAKRASSCLSLIMMDIDYFKLYNDHYGHPEGDKCLHKVAMALTKSVKRATDLVARYGGEEFSCVLPLTDEKGALSLAHEIQHHIIALHIPHQYSAVADYITMSIGVATMIPDRFSLPETLIEAADKALYEAKISGRNQTRVWNSL
jgi:diguanylate cyclase (GGDEF)-like protein